MLSPVDSCADPATARVRIGLRSTSCGAETKRPAAVENLNDQWRERPTRDDWAGDFNGAARLPAEARDQPRNPRRDGRRGPRRLALQSQARGDLGDASELEWIGRLLGTSAAEIDRARSVFTLLGDPARRTILERIARQPQTATEALPRLTGMSVADTHHRLRSLRRAKLMKRGRHHIYSVDPQTLSNLRNYADLLMTAAAHSSKKTRR